MPKMVDKFVVDTNVPIVANERDINKILEWSLECQLACFEFLKNCRDLDIVLDDQGLILAEYQTYLSFSGQPGIGDMFFKYLHDNQYTSDRIHHATITPLIMSPDAQARGFSELPPNKLDPSDRKLLATAIQAEASIVNATDSDWQEQQKLLTDLGVKVLQLCPEYATKN